MTLWFRDVLMLKATSDPNLYYLKRNIRPLENRQISGSYDQIENIINSMEEAKIKLRANVNFDITIELMLLNIKENYNV